MAATTDTVILHCTASWSTGGEAAEPLLLLPVIRDEEGILQRRKNIPIDAPFN
jgi:hypothetical protein